MNGFKGEGEILNENSYQTMLYPQLSRNKFEENETSALNDQYNVGVFLVISNIGYRLHKGASMGAYSILYINPTNDIEVIAYCNLARPDFWKIVTTLKYFEGKFKVKPAVNY